MLDDTPNGPTTSAITDAAMHLQWLARASADGHLIVLGDGLHVVPVDWDPTGWAALATPMAQRPGQVHPLAVPDRWLEWTTAAPTTGRVLCLAAIDGPGLLLGDVPPGLLVRTADDRWDAYWALRHDARAEALDFAVRTIAARRPDVFAAGASSPHRTIAGCTDPATGYVATLHREEDQAVDLGEVVASVCAPAPWGRR